MHIVFTGIQGCGKGTQARLLRDRYGFTIVEMGGELRAEIESGSELWNRLAEVMNSGKMVSEELGREIMAKALQKYKDTQNVIFDGFIRMPWNVTVFESEIPNYKVLFFHLDAETAKSRLLGRMFNPKTGETFPSDMTHDPKTWDELVHRDDDTEKWILWRIDEFVTKALPIVEHQREQGIVLDINADQWVDQVFSDIEQTLNLAK